MIHDAPLLKQHLATIEARGLEHLRDAGRRAALQRGLCVALLGLPVVPVLAFLIGWFVALWPLAVVMLTLLLAAISFGVAFVAIRGRHHLVRRDALALYDRGLGLKDRLQAADEFLADEHRDGFRQAALREAAPWIARAQERSLAGPEGRLFDGARRFWPAVAAALALLLLSLVQQRFLPPAAAETTAVEQPSALHRVARQAAAALHIGMPQGEGLVPDHRQATSGPRLETSPPGGQDGGQHSPLPSATRAEQAHAAAAGGLAATSAGGSAPASGSSASSPATGQAGHVGTSSSQSAHDGAQDDTSQNPKGNAADTRIDAERSGTADSRGARQSSTGRHNEGSSGSQSPSSSPLGAQRPNDSKNNGGQGQQKRSEQSQPGQGQQSGQNKSDGNDSQGQRYGQDALKISRGSSAMLLAVPMEDRLGGMASPGMVDSVGRKATPHAGASGQTSAQDRGRAQGDTGRLGHRPLTPEERRLMQDYFHPAAPAGR